MTPRQLDRILPYLTPQQFVLAWIKDMQAQPSIRDFARSEAARPLLRTMSELIEDAITDRNRHQPEEVTIGKSVFGGTVRTDIMRRVMPFYSFIHESTRIFGEGMKRKPLRMAMWGLAPTALSMASRAILGLDDEEYASVRKEMRGQVGGVPIFSALLPFRDSQGRLQQWDMTNIVPWANPMGFRLDREAMGGEESTKSVAQNMVQSIIAGNPVSAMAQTFGSNRDAFFGRNIVQSGMSRGEWLKQWSMEVARQLLPPMLGRDLLNAVVDSPGGPAPTLLRPDRIPRGFDQKRGVEQTYLRGLAGADLRSAEPRVPRLVTEWMKKTGSEASRSQQVDTTARQRAGDRFFQAVRNKDVGAMAEAMSDLEDQGAEIRSAAAMVDRLKNKHPLTMLREKDRWKFRKDQNPTDLAAVNRAVDEWEQTRRDALSLRARAIGKMREKRPRATR
jgi:hypothetical protein